MNVAMNRPMAISSPQPMAAGRAERGETTENDRDTDDSAAKAVAARPSVNLNGQAIGQLLNVAA